MDEALIPGNIILTAIHFTFSVSILNALSIKRAVMRSIFFRPTIFLIAAASVTTVMPVFATSIAAILINTIFIRVSTAFILINIIPVLTNITFVLIRIISVLINIASVPVKIIPVLIRTALVLIRINCVSIKIIAVLTGIRVFPSVLQKEFIVIAYSLSITKQHLASNGDRYPLKSFCSIGRSPP